MEYKILINKEAKPVLVEAHEPADTQNHISFKHPHLETKDILWELFRTKTKFAHLQELVGQTFDLPANVKVSFEYRYMGQSCFDGETYQATPISLVGKLAVLSTEPAANQQVPSEVQDFRITLPNRSEIDWEEDFNHENGNYLNKCIECKLNFYGHKRRVICKKCSTPNWAELAKRRPPEDTKDNKAWAGAWLEGEMVGYAKCMVEKVLPAASEVQQGGSQGRLYTKEDLRTAFEAGNAYPYSFEDWFIQKFD